MSVDTTLSNGCESGIGCFVEALPGTESSLKHNSRDMNSDMMPSSCVQCKQNKRINVVADRF